MPDKIDDGNDKKNTNDGLDNIIDIVTGVFGDSIGVFDYRVDDLSYGWFS